MLEFIEARDWSERMKNMGPSLSHKHKSLGRFFSILDKIVDWVAGIATLGIIITVMIQILGRVFGNPAPWTEEATRFIFIWVIFIGIAMGFRKSESARVTIVITYAPAFVRKLSKWLYVVASFGFFLFMIIYGFDLMMQQVNMNEMGSALMIPMWIIGISVPVSGILGIFGVIESLIFYPETLAIERSGKGE